MKRFLALSVFVFFTLFQSKAQVTPPTIQACGTEQQFCLTQALFELCVKIEVTPGLPSPIDHFEIDWGDMTALTIVPGGNNPANQFHDYDLNGFFMTCTYDIDFFVVLETFLENGDVLNSSFRVTFINPPKAAFDLLPAVICVGEEACFDNDSCPLEQLSVVDWNYGDGTSGTQNCHTYNTVGSYQISLTVENPCGMATTTQTLQVIEPPTAEATVTSGVVDPSADTLVVCLGGGGLVLLNGDSLSLNENNYDWDALTSGANYNWEVMPPSQNDPTIPRPGIRFLREGVYLVVLEVNNACDRRDRDTLIFNVLDANALVLDEQADACLTLDYSPDPFNPDASYFVDGVLITTFPASLPLGLGMHTVEAILNNACGNQMQVDSFEVTDVVNVAIELPLVDTTSVCVGSERILLEASPEGGDWTGSVHLVEENDSVWFDPVAVDFYELSYGKGTGDCRGTASIFIEVEGVEVIAADYLKCDWSETFLLEASPSGGTWSSSDCPACILANDSFSIEIMAGMGLSTVALTYEVASVAGCEGVKTINVVLENPAAQFTVVDTICIGNPISVNTSNTVADAQLWRINGSLVAPPPFSALSAGNYTIEQVAIVGECRDSLTQGMTLIAPPTSFGFTASPLDSCADLELNIVNTSSLAEGLSFVWSLDGNVFSNANNPGSIILGQGLSDTSYVLSLAVANGCGGEEVSETITVYPRPIANFGTDQSTYCSGETIHFGNASYGDPDSLFWDFGNGLTSSVLNPDPLIYFTDSIPRSYPVTLFAFNDCGIDTITQEVLINPTDVQAFFNTDPTTACVGEEICFENFSTFGAAILFDFGDGNTTNNPQPCHVYDSPGTYKVSLKAFGCGFDSVFTMVTILPLPLVDIPTETIQRCPNDSIIFTAVTSEVTSFFWDFGDGNTSDLSQAQHAYTTPGNYIAKLTGRSLNGCEQTDSVFLTILAPPVAQFSPASDSLCVGNTINFINLSSGNISTCFWDFGDGNFSNDCSPSHEYGSAASFEVSLVVTNNNGCQDTFHQLINVFAEPAPLFDIVLNRACTPVEASFLNLSTQAQSYFWDFGNGETSSETNPMSTYLQGGTYSVTLMATNGLCSRTTAMPLEIRQTPELLTALSAQEGCAPFAINFEAIVAGDNLSYQWDFADGTISFDPLVEHLFTAPGIYPVKLLVESPYCADSLIENITIFEPVMAAVDTTHILCHGAATGSIDLMMNGGTPPFEFTWLDGPVTEDRNDLLAGKYTVLIRDDNECEWRDSFTLIEPAPLVATVIDSSIVSCYGGDDGALCIEVIGGIEGYTISWEIGVEGPCIENLPADEYDVLISDENDCELQTAFAIFQNPSIAVSDSLRNVSCFGAGDGWIGLDTISGGYSDFYNTSLVGPVTYEGGTAFPDLLPGTYQLTIQDLEACTLEKTYTIGEPDSLWAVVQEDSLFIGLGDSVEIDLSHNAISPEFVWSEAASLDCANCEDPFAKPLETTIYELLLSDQNNCTARDTVTVVVDPNRHFYIPNTFTPDGDGRNDVFRVRSRLASIRQVNMFQIYDRWGELLFSARNFSPQEELPENAWDGTFRGKALAPDVFVYFVEVEYLDGKTEAVEGTITLIR